MNVSEDVLSHLERYPAIKVKHLLTHTSGMETNDVVTQRINENFNHQTTLNERIKMYASLEVTHQPGLFFRYSPYVGFDILSKIVEEISGQPFDHFIDKEICEPLNMSSTSFAQKSNSRLAGLYFSDMNGLKIVGSEFNAENYFSGAAGLFSTINDYSHIAEFFLNQGFFEGKQILSEETFRIMTTPLIHSGWPGTNDHEGWCFGMRFIEHPHVLPQGCYGWSGAYGTHFWIDPLNKLYAIFMMNLKNAGGANCQTLNNFERLVYQSIENM